MVFMFAIFAASMLLTLVMLNLVVAFDAVLDNLQVKYQDYCGLARKKI